MQMRISGTRGMAIALLSGAALLGAAAHPRAAVAQSHPQMSNVVPDGGTGSVEGKVVSLDQNSRQIMIAPKGAEPLALYVGPSVRTDNIEQGDDVEANYGRQIFWIVTPTSSPAPEGATATVGQVPHTPGGIGPGATQLSGRIVKMDQGRSFDLVDATGGGVYTIMVVDPSKAALMSNLQVGNAITVSLTPLTISAMQKCGRFGCS